ncbi:PE-PPE domain-containing protein [Mycolicibacterium moriokaense]|nr:PE-PPE domain-containing protein [Mycolicibacterium moriokaense]
MAVKLRSFFLAVLAIAATVVIATVPGVAPQVALLAATAIIMGGAGHSLAPPPGDDAAFVEAYTANRLNNYVDQSGLPGAPTDKTLVVITPEQRILGFGFDPSFTFRGIFDGPFDQAVSDGQRNLDLCLKGDANCAYNQDASTPGATGSTSYIVYGYSQSSSVATMEKIALAQQYPKATTAPGEAPDIAFDLTANGNRPSGGLLTRGPAGLTIPIIGLTFGNPTPTDTLFLTADVGREYDGWVDQPLNPLNPFAELNSWMGQIFLHVNYDKVSMDNAVVQDQVGDTTYYLIPTEIVPLLIPLDSVPVVGHALAVTADPFVRVLVESGYDRTISPGTPTEYNLLYFPNPVDFAHNLALSIPTGLDNGVADVTGDPNNRPFGTEVPGPYGVGGPPVNISEQQSQLQASQQQSDDPVVTAATENSPEPDPTTQGVLPKRPILTALNNAATRIQAQGEVRENPLATPNGSTVLLQGSSGSGNSGVSGAGTGIGAPLKQLGQTLKAAVDSVLKPKAAATGDSPAE